MLSGLGVDHTRGGNLDSNINNNSIDAIISAWFEDVLVYGVQAWQLASRLRLTHTHTAAVSTLAEENCQLPISMFASILLVLDASIVLCVCPAGDAPP